MIKSSICFFLLFLIFSGICSAEKSAFSADEVIREMDRHMRGDTVHGTAVMRIKTASWERNLTVKFWVSGTDRALLKVIAPAKEAGNAFLRIGTDMWWYTPNIEKPIRINVAMMMQPWMGSDFTYDDMMKATDFMRDYTHRIVRTYEDNGSRIWFIESVPKKGTVVLWEKLLFQIGGDFVPRRQEFYDERGKMVKVLEFSDIREINGRLFPCSWTMKETLKNRSSTHLKYTDIVFDKPIPTGVFSLSNLNR